MTTTTAGITGDNSEINMAVRSGVPVATDDATGRSTATEPPVDSSVLGNENFDMGGSETSLDFSLSPSKDKNEDAAAPPASRQRRGEGPAMMAIGPPLASVRKRPSSTGPPPRAGRTRAADALWPDAVSAVHGRVKRTGDQWTILQLVGQLEIDREQIAMVKESLANLHTARLQDAADHLALAKRMDVVDSEDVMNRESRRQQRQEIMGMKETTQKAYDELKNNVGHFGIVQARVEVIEIELTKMHEFTSGAKPYLEQLNSDRPAEGLTIVQAFAQMTGGIGQVRAEAAQSVAAIKDLEQSLSQHVATTAARFEQTSPSVFTGAASSSGLDGNQAALLADLAQTASNLVQDVNVLKAAHTTWNGECHCKHVTENTNRINVMETMLRSSNRAGYTSAPAFCGAYGTPPSGPAPLMQPPGGVRGAMGVHADEPAGEIPGYLQAVQGGNGKCHCWRVTMLDTRVAVL